MDPLIKLSSPATNEFWKIAVLFEDADLFALNKPSRLLVSPDRYDPTRPNLMRLLHEAIARGARWARERGIAYLSNAHRLDFETSGVLLLARNKPALIRLADQFGSEKPQKRYVALIHGSPPKEVFEAEAKLGFHPTKLGLVRVDPKSGKKARTSFRVLERFGSYSLVECKPETGRTHQIRVHLQWLHYPIVGDQTYHGSPLLLSFLKSSYRLKPGAVERPLLDRVALHAEELSLPHPTNGQPVTITAPWPKDLVVAVKYLRLFANR